MSSPRVAIAAIALFSVGGVACRAVLGIDDPPPAETAVAKTARDASTGIPDTPSNVDGGLSDEAEAPRWPEFSCATETSAFACDDFNRADGVLSASRSDWGAADPDLYRIADGRVRFAPKATRPGTAALWTEPAGDIEVSVDFSPDEIGCRPTVFARISENNSYVLLLTTKAGSETATFFRLQSDDTGGPPSSLSLRVAPLASAFVVGHIYRIVFSVRGWMPNHLEGHVTDLTNDSIMLPTMTFEDPDVIESRGQIGFGLDPGPTAVGGHFDNFVARAIGN